MTAFADAGNDQKKLWRIIRQLFGNSKKRSQINTINGYSEPLHKANAINNFFIDIGPDLADAIPDSLLEPDYELREDRPLFDLHEVDHNTVRKLLNNTSINKSTRIDGVPIKFLKMCEPVSFLLITHIINLSIKTKIIPDGWKRACLTPVFKNGDPNNPTNYRTIAILPASSKILEHVVHDQVMAYINEHKILSGAQFGFMKGHSNITYTL